MFTPVRREKEGAVYSPGTTLLNKADAQSYEKLKASICIPYL